MESNSAVKTPTVAIEGTWARGEEVGWADPRSEWAKAALAAGVNLIDPDEPFEWSTALEGLRRGQHPIWETSGMALKWYCHKYAPGEPVNLIAHSHGGQVAAYALAQGLKGNLITVATPVRGDMRKVWAKAAVNMGRWRHVYTDEPWWKGWQNFGEIFDGRFGWTRKMPAPAENVKIPGEDHSSLMDPRVWRAKRLWGVGVGGLV